MESSLSFLPRHESPSRWSSITAAPRAARSKDPLPLAALARRGSAAALCALTALCLSGPVEDRLASLRLLPRLVPFQPIWPIFERADRPDQPSAVRAQVRQLRGRLDDPRQHAPIYRRIQHRLVQGFLAAQKAPLRADRPAEGTAQHLRWVRAIVDGFYDYRFEQADACLGGVEERHVSEYLLEYAPRRLLIDIAGRRQAPRVLSRHLSWLAELGRLLPLDGRRLCLFSLALRNRYDAALAQEAQPGSPRALLQAALAGDPGDAAAQERSLALLGLDLDEEFLPI